MIKNLDEHEKRIFIKFKNEYNLYISDIEDFFNLPEYIQDKIIRNPYFDYVKIWDKLDYEHKFQLVIQIDFKYEELWDKLGVVEKSNVIQFAHNFDWQKYIPYPTNDELNILLNRHDFCPVEFFHKLSSEQKLRVCSKSNFKYEKFWNELTLSMKREIVKHNDNFDPLPHIEELIDTNDYLDDEVRPVTLLDDFCDRKITLQKYYKSIWNKLDDFQKMKIAIKNKNYINDNIDEMYELFKKYPFQLLDYIKYKIIPERDLFKPNIEPEICFVEIKNEKDREMAYKIFKMFGLINHEDLIKMRKEMSVGNGVIEISFSKELQRYFPFCVVKVKYDININSFSKKIITPGYYFCDVQSYNFTKIIDYQYTLREAKIERLLNNSSD